MIRFRMDAQNATVVAVECSSPGWPNLDDQGEKQFGNTHFDDEAVAWERLVAELEAGVCLTSSSRVDLQERLCEATERLADLAQRFALAKQRRDERLREVARG